MTIQQPIILAGFWSRFFAYLIDVIITLGIVITVTSLIIPIPSPSEDHNGGIMFIILLLAGVQWILTALMESSALQASFGKMLFSIHVANDEGGRISLWQATIRYFWKFFFQWILGLAIIFLVVLFTSKKQAIHDFIAETLVVKNSVCV